MPREVLQISRSPEDYIQEQSSSYPIKLESKYDRIPSLNRHDANAVTLKHKVFEYNSIKVDDQIKYEFSKLPEEIRNTSVKVIEGKHIVDTSITNQIIPELL